jgi:hypothetical protein
MATTQPVTVMFNSVEEFIAELEKDAAKVDRQIVRITNLSEGTNISPNIQHVSVFATYTVEGQIIILKRYCGDIWRLGQQRDKEVLAKAKEHLKTIEEACRRLKLEARAGAIQGDRRRCGR